MIPPAASIPSGRHVGWAAIMDYRAWFSGRPRFRLSCPKQPELSTLDIAAWFMLMGRFAGPDRLADLSHAVLVRAQRRLRPPLSSYQAQPLARMCSRQSTSRR